MGRGYGANRLGASALSRSEEVSGTAEVVTGAEFERCKGIVKKKYGIQFTLMTIVGKAAKLIGKGSGTDCAVKITLA